MLGAVFVILFILLLIGGLPAWPHSQRWGYFPSGALGLLVLIMLLLLLLGQI